MGPTGQTGQQVVLDSVRALAGNTIDSRSASNIIGYYHSEGTMASHFDNTTGVFTAPVRALYLVP